MQPQRRSRLVCICGDTLHC